LSGFAKISEISDKIRGNDDKLAIKIKSFGKREKEVVKNHCALRNVLLETIWAITAECKFKVLMPKVEKLGSDSILAEKEINKFDRMGISYCFEIQDFKNKANPLIVMKGLLDKNIKDLLDINNYEDEKYACELVKK
jgi:hypothetical protein